ncbi:ribosome biogenesis GTPase Der [Clostridium cylindrosporum]|uniref:GTPase Der n=1 Tax=Clostridium cylindrosporum DSM 605 TaxID=1121307 RepID=A0A0J8G0W9_CLOCY|nr:ribosome biogenesis GTPase Der [Clostridium cylindrosporum]KMT21426.1 GTPase Der [Clostridium cylindrosporum DSM 605]
MSKPIVAVVGRPNVGKSTLFNKLAGDRISIVEDTPGVTRDRIYAEVEWLTHKFTLIDTGGIEPDSEDIIVKQMRRQAEIAIETADVIVFIVDGREGIVAADYEVATMLRKCKKPVELVVNKLDNISLEENKYEFYNLGIGDPIAISASQGLGLGDMLDEIVENFNTSDDSVENETDIKVAIIGKPNAGKSSLLNNLSGEERAIVSDVPGTTRDAIDSYVQFGEEKFLFIDTAGIRRKSKVSEEVERYSVLRAITSIERADVCVIMIDATKGVTEQDEKIAGLAHEAGRASVIVVNKWDLIEKNDKTMNEFTDKVRCDLAFMPYAPIVFISAKTGQRVNKLIDVIKFVAEKHNMRIKTGVLNEVISEAVMMKQPPVEKGKPLKIYYVTQVSTKPPTFVFFVNYTNIVHFSYQRYLENQLRQHFGLEGTPIKIIYREKKDD